MNHDKVGATILPAFLQITHGQRPFQQPSHPTSWNEGVQPYPLGTVDTYDRRYHVSSPEYPSPSTPQSMAHVYDNGELHTTYPSTCYAHEVNYTSAGSTSQQMYSPVGPSIPSTYGPANYRASPQVSHRQETTGPYSYYSAATYPTSQQTPSAAEFPQTGEDRWQLQPQKPSRPTPYPNPQYIEMHQTIAISDSPASPQRPFSCDLCTLSFNRQHDLKRHRETHTGEKPFICNGGCGKTFTRKDALKRHQVSNARLFRRILTRFRS